VAQTLTLTATVDSPAGTVNQGTVTFTILNNTKAVGTAVSGNVGGGTASAIYTLPAGTTANSYIIQAAYGGGSDFVGYTDTGHDLTVNQAATSSNATNVPAVFSTSKQTISLSAAVTSPAGAVSQGTETFSLLNSSKQVIGSPVTVNVSSSAASANYSLPGNTAAGTYTIQAVYNGTTDFAGSSDTSHALTVSAANATTAAANASATYSAVAQTVSLSATVSSSAGTVNEGQETFQVYNGSTPVGNPVTQMVINGKVSVNYTLPGGTAVGTYIIQATYSGSTDYIGFIDSSHTLTINAPAAPAPAASPGAVANTSVPAGTQAAPLDSAGNDAPTPSSTKHRTTHAKLKVNRGPLALGTLASHRPSRSDQHHRVGETQAQSAADSLRAHATVDLVIDERGRRNHHRH
jgi:hypothetical protein